MDKDEAENFVKEVSKTIDQERAKNFDIDEFPQLFETFDEDKNGFLSKAEMAQFIKVVFKSNKSSIKSSSNHSTPKSQS